MKGYLILLFVGFVRAPGGHNAPKDCGHHNQPACPDEVIQAFVNLHLHYNEDMCLELLLIDCATHVTQGDEVICGSNGKTYANHCRFIHEWCEFHLIGQNSHVKVQHSGPCVTATTTGPITGPITGHITTMSPLVVTASTVMTSTGLQLHSTTSPPAVDSLIQQLFCRNVDTVVCSQEFAIVCGTDGQFYPNSCELSRAKCKNPSLTVEQDSSKCTIPGK